MTADRICCVILQLHQHGEAPLRFCFPHVHYLPKFLFCWGLCVATCEIGSYLFCFFYQFFLLKWTSSESVLPHQHQTFAHPAFKRPHNRGITHLCGFFLSSVRSLLSRICHETAAAAKEGWDIHVPICKWIHKCPVFYKHMHSDVIGPCGTNSPQPKRFATQQKLTWQWSFT